MIVQCPNCRAEHSVPQKLVSNANSLIRCRSCQTPIRFHGNTAEEITAVGPAPKRVAAATGEMAPSVGPVMMFGAAALLCVAGWHLARTLGYLG